MLAVLLAPLLPVATAVAPTAPPLSSSAESDTAALLAFKQAINADSFEAAALGKWTAGGGPACGRPGGAGPWPQVMCSATGHVTGLALSGANLTGSLSPALGNLSQLAGLDLSFNRFEGGIPDELASLTALRGLNLSVNLLGGPVPPFLGTLARLTSLDLSFNAFNGTIPVKLSRLRRLVTLSLAGNQLGGGITPTLGSLGPQLTALDLSRNFLEGVVPPELGALQSLRTLFLFENYLTGPFPPALTRLSQLVALDLHSSGLSGPIPPQIGLLRSLTFLDLSGNSFSGALPPALGALALLTYLDVSSNSLSGALPLALGRLTQLQNFFANNNKLSGGIPARLGSPASVPRVIDTTTGEVAGGVSILLSANNLTGALPPQLFAYLGAALVWFDASANSLTGGIPPEVGLCPNLTDLYLGGNNLSGTIPRELGSLPQLLTLSFYNNSLNGTIPPELGTYAISTIDLSANQLTGPIPASFNCAYALQSSANLPLYLAPLGQQQIFLQGNRLSGDIPPALFEGCAQYLTDLDFSNNSLSGPIPPGIAGATNLNSTYFQSNRLSGGMPDLSALTYLNYLDWSDNELSGPLPESIGGAAALQLLGLAGNRLSGRLPRALGQLATLTHLDLSGNNFSGPLPDTFPPAPANTSLLSRLFLQRNQLSGALPTRLGDLPRLQEIDVSDNAFSGPVLQFNGSLVSISLAGNGLTGVFPSSLVGLASLQTIRLAGNRLHGLLPNGTNWRSTGLEVLDVQQNNFSGPIPTSFDKLSQLRELNLAQNALSGPIPATLGSLSHLSVLDLHDNNLTGDVPTALTALPSLAYLDLSNNGLSGPLPEGGALAGVPASQYAGNSLLCGAPLFACPRPPGGGGLSASAIAAIAIGSVALAAAMTAAAVLARRIVMPQAGGGGPIVLDPSNGELVLYEQLPFRLTIEDLQAATEDFSTKFLLGKGGFGSVYRATLPDGTTDVAIKRLEKSSTQGEKEFLAEMETLGGIRHRNLVTLIGTYLDHTMGERLLIYNFFSGGSLEDALYGNKQSEALLRDWGSRWRAALGAARGLKYLHHNCHPRIIHRDVKPANVLLDGAQEAHVADFGLARLLDRGASHVSTSVCGTIGYIAPECAHRARVTEKADVFAYGVLLLQLVTGVRPTDRLVGSSGLRTWTLSRPPAQAVDKALVDAKQHEGEIAGALALGQLCTCKAPASRPSMAEVVHLLENLTDFGTGLLANHSRVLQTRSGGGGGGGGESGSSGTGSRGSAAFSSSAAGLEASTSAASEPTPSEAEVDGLSARYRDFSGVMALEVYPEGSLSDRA